PNAALASTPTDRSVTRIGPFPVPLVSMGARRPRCLERMPGGRPGPSRCRRWGAKSKASLEVIQVEQVKCVEKHHLPQSPFQATLRVRVFGRLHRDRNDCKDDGEKEQFAHAVSPGKYQFTRMRCRPSCCRV